MSEKYEKLVRDMIPRLLKEKDVSFEERTATPEEYEAELMKKLREERAEFNQDKSVEELADIIEVVDAIKKLPNLDKEHAKEVGFVVQFIEHSKTLPEYANVEEVRQKKLQEKGGFKNRIIAKGEK